MFTLIALPQMRSVSRCSEREPDGHYCVGRPCCCLSCLSKSWEDHFIIVCLPCLMLLSRREPLGKWGLAAIFAVCSFLAYLLAWPYEDFGSSLTTCSVRFVTHLASVGITLYDGPSRCQWLLQWERVIICVYDTVTLLFNLLALCIYFFYMMGSC